MEFILYQLYGSFKSIAIIKKKKEEEDIGL